MNIYSSNGPAGVGVAYASFTVLNALIKHLLASGALIPADLNKILDDALNQVPADRNSAREDARRFIEGLKQ